MSEIKLLGLSGQDNLRHMSEAGFSSVFDIIRHDRAGFLRMVPGINEKDARDIYRVARQRAENLKLLFRSWQLRREPVIAGLEKLAPDHDSGLKNSILRGLGGEGDFHELMARSSEFADTASIQSLFSPGRYAASLYAVAQKLHAKDSALSIDVRRPDLKSLILSEFSMNQEVTSLDVLLNVLQTEEGNTLSDLSSSFFPMNLPYDDNLSQIEKALAAQGRTLNGIWDVLSGTGQQAVATTYMSGAPEPELHSSTTVRAGNTAFYLKANEKMVWLTNATFGNGVVSANLVLGEPVAAAVAIPSLKFARGGAEQQLFIGISGEMKLDGKDLTDAWITGTDGQQHDKDGRFAIMANKNQNGLRPEWHLPVTMDINADQTVMFRTRKGYIGYDNNVGDGNWKNPLVLDADRENALSFTLCSDDSGKHAINPVEPLPVPALPSSTPNPPTRTTLSLTPVSYQLMVNDVLNEADIAEHYGLKNTVRNTDALVGQLNDISVYCNKTGLKFNDVLAMTAQEKYSQRGEDTDNRSQYIKYGDTHYSTVYQYGAVFLNSKLGDVQSADNRPLWIQPESRDDSGHILTPVMLNFREDTVTGLAGNAEKLIRLRQTTGLPFEALDWIIVNASRAAGYDSSSLDANVLGAMATCVDLQKRYGISSDVAVSFIGSVNPYARKQEKSLYERLFTYPDQTSAIPLGGLVNYTRGDEPYTAACCAALGVTSDEFARIAGYCFGSAGTFNMTPETAGQIYRFGTIPRMLGLSFAEAECLWTLMDGGNIGLLMLLSKSAGLAAFNLISRTEQVLAWMTDNNLNLIQLQAMVSTRHSTTATAEMYTFLQNVYHSVEGSPDAAEFERGEQIDDALRQKVLRAIAGGFGIKTNIAGPITNWLAAISGFTLADYWSAIRTFFSVEDNTTVDTLQEQAPELIFMTQRLSQLVVISRWLDLSEQDLNVLTITPTQLSTTLAGVPSPDISLMLLLSRFKRWQTQVTVTRDEALRLLPFLAEKDTAAGDAAVRISALHNLNQDTVALLGELMFGAVARPESFEQLWQLLVWARTGEALNVGAATLDDLMSMARSNEAAEDHALIARVASNLVAGLNR